MRKIILAFLFMLVSAIGALAQSTTVSGTVTDASSQAWANGKYSFTFQPNPQFPTGPYTWSGGTLNNVIPGTLDSSGAYSVSIPSSSAITPAGSTWILQVTPDATSLSFSTARTTITGGTQTLNATPPTILISWSLPPGPAISAYTDAEIGGTLPKGAEYFNTTSNLTRVWNGSAWANQGTGGGGGTCPAGAAGNIQYTNGTNCASTNKLNYNAGTDTLLVQPATQLYSAIGGTIQMISGPTGANLFQIDGVNGFTIQAAESGPGNNVEFNATGEIDFFAPLIQDFVGSASAVIPGSVIQRVVTGTTDTILDTDRTNRVAYNSATAVAVSLPTAGSTGFAGGFNVRLSNQNTGTVTITPATGTINGNATLVLLEGQFCFLSPSSAGTSYAADCGESQMTAGTGISFTRTVHGLTITNSAAAGITNNVIPKGTGTSLTNSSVTDNGTTVATTEPVSTTGSLTSGANGGAAGSLVLNGSTSGSVTLTTNAGASNLSTTSTFSASVLSASSQYQAFGRTFWTSTAPTIATGGCGGSGATISNTVGNAAFDINVGTGPTSAGCTLTFPSITTGWIVSCNDQTTQSATVFVQKQTGAVSQTSVVIQTFAATGSANAPTASDVYHCTAMGH